MLKLRILWENCLQLLIQSKNSILEDLDDYEFLSDNGNLRWFLSIALRIPTAHDFCVISARKLARARTQQKKFSIAK